MALSQSSYYSDQQFYHPWNHGTGKSRIKRPVGTKVIDYDSSASVIPPWVRVCKGFVFPLWPLMVHSPIQSAGLVGILCALEISNTIPAYPATKSRPY